MGDGQHAHGISGVCGELADFQLPLSEAPPVPPCGSVDAAGGHEEALPSRPGMVAEATIEDRCILCLTTGGTGHPPREPLTGPPPGGGLTADRGERVTFGDSLEERQPEQIALAFVDRDGEVIVQRVTERMTHQKCATAMHAQRVDGGIANTVAGDHLRRDRLPLAALARIDRRRGPPSEGI